jgi:hypothetical protein
MAVLRNFVSKIRYITKSGRLLEHGAMIAAIKICGSEDEGMQDDSSRAADR